jgi:signal transduction histidine kinase|nr:HAMP domain-containing sensor histidine kinase [Candidatus Krumholzibacteria bacterium]
MKRRRGLLYGILVGLLLVMGVWWMYFLTHEASVHAQFKRQKLANDKLHASFLIQSDPRVMADPERWLGQSFPHLTFTRGPHSVDVSIDPAVLKEVDDQARRTRNMFLFEGLFFMVLLAAGSTILVLSWRSEARFVQARELFLAGATHEFKTPLASLKLYTETLGRQGLKESDSRRIRDRMIEDVGRLERLVNEVLSMSAEDTFASGPRSTVDLVRETNEVILDLEGFARDHDSFIEFQHQDAHFISGQAVPFALALRNLLVNAIKHADEGVSILVTLTHQRGWHHLAVKDNGPGIPRRLQGRVFDCFYSKGPGRGPAGGSGLGLYLVKRNIKALGGRVTLDSEEGKGSTFTLILPASPSDPNLEPEDDI